MPHTLHDTPPLSTGQPVPDFRLLDIAGRSVALSQCLGERGCVLLFFSGLGLDDVFLKAYAQAYAELQVKGIEVLAVSGRDWDVLRRLHGRLALPYRILFDPCVRVSKRYEAISLPRFLTGRRVFVLDAEGRLRASGPRLSPQQALAVLSEVRSPKP